MFAMYANGWPSALEDPIDERDRFQRIALDEARIASEWHAQDAGPGESYGVLDLVRRFIGVAPAQPACAECAA